MSNKKRDKMNAVDRGRYRKLRMRLLRLAAFDGGLAKTRGGLFLAKLLQAYPSVK